MSTLELPRVEDTIKQFDYWQQNPADYFKQVFKNAQCYDKQIEIAESVRDNEETFVPSCHGVGKTFIAARIALWFSNCFIPSVVVTTAPTGIQVKTLLWGEIHKHANSSDAFEGIKLNDTYLEWSEDHYMLGRTAKVETAEHDQGVRFQGFHGKYILFILDEGPGVPQAIWDAIEGGMTSAFCRKLAIGNPTAASGPFYNGCKSGDGKVVRLNIFHSPNFIANNIKSVEDLKSMADWEEEDFNKLKQPSFELTTPKWAVKRLKKWGEDSPLFQSRVIGEFPVQSTDNLVALAWCDQCVEPDWKKAKITKKTLAIDVARFGSDNTCFFGMEHNEEVYRHSYNGHDLMKTSNFALNLVITEGYETVIVDADGIGSGVADRLREQISTQGLKCSVIDYHGGEAATKYKKKVNGKVIETSDYTNKRTESWWKTREALREIKIKINDDGDLFDQLTGIKYNFDESGKIKLEKKEDYKKRTGKQSPDEADALVMCVWGTGRSDIVQGITQDLAMVEDREMDAAPWEM